MHPYLVESGFQAIAGRRSITGTEARHITSLEPITTLSDYVFVRPCLHVNRSGAGWAAEFQGNYAHHRSRFWRKLGCLVVYVVAALAPFWLIILEAAHVRPRGEAFQLAIEACGFWPVAYIAMLEAARIVRAEGIVSRACG